MRVLTLGIYRTDAPSLYPKLVAELGNSQKHSVTQLWIPMREGVGKFEALNGMLREVGRDLNYFDYTIITDDDITLPTNFVDHYLELVERFDFSLAQPARTLESSIHHDIVRQRVGLLARQTRFVEIGPLFSVRRDFYRLFPFADTKHTPMGWGFCFTWPLVVEGAGRRMGIIDATPVDHTIRPDILYDVKAAGDQMTQYLLSRPHLSREQAYQTLAVFEEEHDPNEHRKTADGTSGP